MASLPARTKLGIALEMVRFTKPGRLSQWVEPLAEAGQLLAANGWKASDRKATFVEIDTPEGV